ncbi:hypothetical protein KQH82_06980 [bacterium]|nr:hypothetical protein [bacterium]
MAYGGGAAAAAAAAAAIANAIKASGSLVRMAPDDFIKILHRNKDGLVVVAKGGIFTTNYQYLTSYKGICFYTKVSEPLNIPGTVEQVHAEKIWMPS